MAGIKVHKFLLLLRFRLIRLSYSQNFWGRKKFVFHVHPLLYCCFSERSVCPVAPYFHSFLESGFK